MTRQYVAEIAKPAIVLVLFSDVSSDIRSPIVLKLEETPFFSMWETESRNLGSLLINSLGIASPVVWAHEILPDLYSSIARKLSKNRSSRLLPAAM